MGALCSCCCCCCDDEPSLVEMMKTPPTVEEVRRLMETLQKQSKLPESDDSCCFCLPRRVLCCCCYRPPPKDWLVDGEQFSKSAAGLGSRSFLGNRAALALLARLFRSARDKVKVRAEYVSAALVLLSSGDLDAKMRGLFESFGRGAGLDRGVLERLVRAVVEAGIEISSRVSSHLSKATTGGLVPGGALVRAALGATNALVGTRLVDHSVESMLKSMDRDGGGEIGWDEFRAVALSRDSMVRKFVQWFDRKGQQLRGTRPDRCEGPLSVDGRQVHARLYALGLSDREQRIVFWDSAEGLRAADEKRAAGTISLREPCHLGGADREDGSRTFFVLDREQRRWVITAPDTSSFFDWVDEVDEYCEAKLSADGKKAVGAGDGACCCLSLC